jgi:hypothetical protein
MPGNKPRICGFYGLALQRLSELQQGSGIIKFPRAFEKLGSTFCIPKEFCWEVLMLRDLGFIEIVPGHGIRLLENNGSKFF